MEYLITFDETRRRIARVTADSRELAVGIALTLGDIDEACKTETEWTQNTLISCEEDPQ